MSEPFLTKEEFEQQQKEVAAEQNPAAPIYTGSQSTLTPEQLDAASREYEQELEFGDRGLEAALIEGGGALSFGALQQILTKTGMYTPDELLQLRNRNTAQAVTAEILGTGASLLVPGGAVGRVLGIAGKGVRGAAKAGQAVEGLSAKAINKLVAETGEQNIAKQVIAKSVPKVAGSSAEATFYGAGQLVKEDALGTAEFNAENLVTALGGSALIGGTLGLGISAALPAAAKVSQIGSKVKNHAAQKFLGIDAATDAALELVGATTVRQKGNIKKALGNRVDDLPDFLATELKLGQFQTRDELYSALTSNLEKSKKALDKAVDSFDPKILPMTGGVIPERRTLFGNIIKELDEKYVAEYGDLKAWTNEMAPVKAAIKDLYKDVNLPGPVTIKELDSLRKRADKLSKWASKSLGPKDFKAEVNRRLATIYRQNIDEILTRAGDRDASLLGTIAEYRKANRNLNIGLTIKESLKSRAESPSSIFSFRDGIAAITGGQAAGTIGAIGGFAGKRLLEGDNIRKFKILTYIEKQNQKVQSQVSKSIKSFFKDTPKAVGTTTKAALIRSEIASKIQDGKEKKPKNEQEAFTNVRENLTELATNPEKLQERALRSTAGLANIAPQTAAGAQEILARSVSFLMSKMPKEVYSLEGLSALKRNRQISDLELAKFTRYLEAVESPLVLLDDLQSGTATREQVEAVSTVYPDLYARIVSETYEYLASEPELAYNKKVQIGLLLNIDADSSLRKDALADLQGRFRAQEAQQAATLEQSRKSASTFTPSNAKNLNIAERMNSEAQEIESGLIK